MALTARQRQKAFSAAGLAVVLGILAAVNVVSGFLFARLDLSTGRAYSISPGTKRTLSELKDNLVIKAYFTRRLPPPYGLSEQYLRDLLGEYKSAGGRRVKLEFRDPSGDERVKQEARSAGVPPVKLSVMARDKFEIKEAYMGLALLYQGRSETIPVLQNREDFEYEITRRVRKLAGGPLKAAGLVSGHGEKGPLSPGYDAVFEAARDNLEIEEVSLSQPLPEKLEALWIVGPERPYAPAELERVKAWVNSGRTLGVMLDRRAVNFQSFDSRPQTTGLEGLLAAWGVEAKDGLVADLQAERIQIQQNQGPFTIMNVIEYPFIPVATAFNSGHPATRGLEAVIFPFVHPVSFVMPAAGGLRYTSLIDSSRYSWVETGVRVSPYDQVRPPEGGPEGPFSLAGIIEGEFFKVTPSTLAATEAGVREPRPGRVIVVGTSRIINPQFALKGPNLGAFLNLLEWSLQDEALLSIRSKGVSYRPLKPLPDVARVLVKNILIFGLPLGLAALGLVCFQLQRRRRAALQERYADA